MNILYLVFGQDINHYQQVFFSIYTAIQYKNSSDRVIVIAEDPTFFHHFGESIEVIPIDRDKIKLWEGEHKFFWRVKIKALELISLMYPSEHILYLDGDTFFYKPISLLKEELDKGQNIMHLNEGALHQLPTKTEKLMWKQMKNKTFANIKIDTETEMWNAGLIGISSKHTSNSINLALQINDELCASNVTRRLIEQLSFSIATNHYSKLKAADHIVGHYWGNKDEWNNVISNWMKKALMNAYTSQQMMNSLLQIPFKEIPIYTKQSNTHKRLLLKLNNIFKPKKKLYIPH